MRQTWRNVKRILREVSSADDPNVINYSSEKAMVDIAYKRLKDHAEQCSNDVTKYGYYIGYLDSEPRTYNLVQTYVHLLTPVQSKTGLPRTAKRTYVQAIINIDPLKHNIKVMKSWHKPPVRALKAAFESIDAIVEPVPTNDGMWWADENYYPLRPMWQGETVDKKPRKTWTVVNGATGDVIKESRGNDRNSLGLNPKSVDAVRREIMERMLAKVGSAEHSDAPGSKTKAASQYTLVLMEDDPDGGPMQPAGPHAMNLVVFDDNVGEATVGIQVDLTDPLRGMVDVVDSWADADEEVIEGYIDELSEDMRPEASTSGLWWGDADFYPIRPLFAGEDPKLKPMSSCTVVDGTTGDAISEVAPKKRKKDVGRITKAAERGMYNKAFERMAAVEKRLKDEGYFVELWMEHSVGNSMYIRHNHDGKQPDFGSRSVVFDIRNALTAAIHDVDETDPREKYLYDLVKDALEPHTHPSGAWWVDENMYLTRAIYDGEPFDSPPYKEWTAIDPETYDPVSV